MPLRLQEKRAIVEKINKIASTSITAAAAEYRGLTVDQMTKLRANARKSDVYLKVVRNTLVRRAVENTSFECIQDRLTGPLIFAFSSNDPGAPARLLRDFAKEHERLVIKFLSIDGQLLEGSEVNTLANLPSREEALSQLMAVMKAPITKFVRTLQEPHAKFVRTMAAYRDKLQAE